jgi:REP element-mobilizing transposase RayT
MSHSLCRCIFHVVFTTKERRNYIPRVSLEKTWAYLAGIARNHDIRVLAAGGTQNHVHLLLELAPDVNLSDAVRILKSNSSRWLRESVRLFGWQQGFYAFSVSPSQVGGVMNYIAHQEKHHSRYSFDEEFRSILKAAGLRVDAQTCAAPEGAPEG